MLKPSPLLVLCLGVLLSSHGLMAQPPRQRGTRGPEAPDLSAAALNEAQQSALLQQCQRQPRDTAIRLWSMLWLTSTHVPIRTEALTELLKHHPTSRQLERLIIPNREREWADALRHLAFFPPSCQPDKVLKELAPHFNRLPLKAKFRMLDACAKTQDSQAFAPLARQAAQSSHELLVCAALTAMIALGTPDDEPMILDIAFNARTPQLENTARMVIAQLPGNTLDQRLDDCLKHPKTQRKAIRFLQDRRAIQQAPAVAMLMQSPNLETAVAATQAMADLATETELQPLIQALNTPRLARHASHTLAELLRRMSFAQRHDRKQRIPLANLHSVLTRNLSNPNLTHSTQTILSNLLQSITTNLYSQHPPTTNEKEEPRP